jgi:hypothetical protein
MFGDEFLDRFQRSMKAEEAPRARSVSSDVVRVVSASAAKGTLQGSATAHQLVRLYEQELDIRVSLGWRIAVRILRDTQFGSEGDLRSDLKNLMQGETDRVRSVLEQELNGHLQKYKLPVASLEARAREAGERHELEVDLYMDAKGRDAGHQQVAPMYNFYGAVGAVQLGPYSVAHVTQHLGTEDKERLLSAIQAVEEVLQQARQLNDLHRNELLQIASDAKDSLKSESPNGTKLRMSLEALSNAVQGIASGGAAYEALRGAMTIVGM